MKTKYMIALIIAMIATGAVADDSFTENSWTSGTVSTPMRSDQTMQLYNPPASAYYPPVEAILQNQQFNQDTRRYQQF